MYQFTSVADDTTLSKRKLKMPVEMANAFYNQRRYRLCFHQWHRQCQLWARNSPAKLWDRLWPMPTPNGNIFVDYGQYVLHPRLPSIKPDPHRRFQQWSAHPIPIITCITWQGSARFNINGSGIQSRPESVYRQWFPTHRQQYGQCSSNGK